MASALLGRVEGPSLPLWANSGPIANELLRKSDPDCRQWNPLWRSYRPASHDTRLPNSVGCSRETSGGVPPGHNRRTANPRVGASSPSLSENAPSASGHLQRVRVVRNAVPNFSSRRNRSARSSRAVNERSHQPCDLVGPSIESEVASRENVNLSVRHVSPIRFRPVSSVERSYLPQRTRSLGTSKGIEMMETAVRSTGRL
jgi:hypothetical protein